jgi:hypothetical protein
MEIVGSRERVRRDLRGLHYELDFPAKFRRSFREQTLLWITAVAAVGVLIALAPMRKKKIYVDRKERSKIKGKACRNRLCFRRAENSREPDPAGDNGAG